MAPNRKDRKRLVPRIDPVPEIISRIPRPYPPSAKELGKLVSDELYRIWISILSKQDHVISGEFTSAAFEKLDALILKQTETLGWRMTLSEIVHMRFFSWDFQPNGPALFREFGKALAKSALRFQKEELPPIDDPDLHLAKKETVKELRQLLHKLRKATVSRRTAPTSHELIALFESAVSADDASFPYLKANIDSWIHFFRTHSTSVKPFVLGKRVSPASLFDSWLAYCKGRDPETVRQMVSELGKFGRDASIEPKL